MIVITVRDSTPLTQGLPRHAAPVLDRPRPAAYCPDNGEVDITITVNLRVRPEKDG